MGIDQNRWGDDTLHWLDVEEIAEALLEAHPEIDPMRLGFVELKRLVVALPNFRERAGHPCNEKILEVIQGGWIEERERSGGGARTKRSADDEE